MTTKQEVFNRVVRHLRAQGEKASRGTACRYHMPDGRKCAVGCLIPKSHYLPEIEGIAVGPLALGSIGHPDDPDGGVFEGQTALMAILDDLGLFSKDMLELLEHLQCVHDHYPPHGWEERFRVVASGHGLKVPKR